MSEINWSKNNYSNRIGLKCHPEMEEMVRTHTLAAGKRDIPNQEDGKRKLRSRLIFENSHQLIILLATPSLTTNN